MHYFGALSKHYAEKNLSLEWISSTGFPVGNRYHEPNKKTVNLLWGAQRVEYTVAEGRLPIVRLKKAIRSAAPNFVHSMDASHLIRVVNAAAEEDINVVTVHDSFSCLAPDAERFNKIIRTQLCMLYLRQNHLISLRDRNGIDPDLFQPPENGTLNPIAVQNAANCWL
jgi:DNA-directed RNA polymerase